MAMRVVLILSCLALVKSGVCLYPTGAPPEACQDMTPQHGFDPQPNPSPYLHEIEKVDDKTFKLSIVGNAENIVEGFMVQARDRSTAEILGTFEAVTEQIRVIDCLGGTANCATHAKYLGAESPERVTVTWMAPDGNPLENINFVYTVVREENEFWVNQIAPLVV